MLVKITGFRLEAGGAIKMPEFCGELARANNTEDKFGGRELVFFAGERDSYLVGLVVTVRNQKTFTEMRRGEGKIVLQARELEKGTNLVDFNYYIVNRQNGYGLYQTYWQAWTFGRLGAYLSERYRDYQRELEREEIERLGGEDKLSKKDKRELRKRYKGRLDFTELVREENLEKLLEDLEAIRSFEYVAATPAIPGKEFIPINPLIEHRKTIVRFDPNVRKGAGLRKGLGKVIGQMTDLKAGRIRGKDYSGYDRVVDLIENPDVFQFVDFDEISKDIQLEIGESGEGAEKFSESPMVDRLIKLAKQHPEIFGK